MSLLFNSFTNALENPLSTLVIILLGLIIIWIIISLPVYIAAKVVTGGKASLFAAMGATILGPIIYILTMYISSIFISSIFGVGVAPLSLILAFLAWLAIYKSAFSTGWLGAFAIAILAVIIFVIISSIIVALIGVPDSTRFFDLNTF